MACGVEKAFEGRRIAVSGGCGGMGRALVAELRRRGASVLVLDLPQSLARHPLPEGVQGFALDARDAGAVARAFEALAGGVEALDGLVNLVGFAREKVPVAAMPDALWHEVVDGNLHATLYLCRAALPLLRRGRGAAIVNIASGLAVKPAPGYGPYSVSKAGVLALTRLLAQEEAPRVRANAIAPSAVDTAFLRGGTGRGGDEAEAVARLDVAAYLQSIPLGRMAEAADIVGPILFLLSPAAAYITGQTLHVNGGMLMV